MQIAHVDYAIAVKRRRQLTPRKLHAANIRHTNALVYAPDGQRRSDKRKKGCADALCANGHRMSANAKRTVRHDGGKRKGREQHRP